MIQRNQQTNRFARAEENVTEPWGLYELAVESVANAAICLSA